MAKETNIGYIVVVFYEGLGYTLQGRGKVHFFFHRGVKYYKSLKRAINKAQTLSTRYINDGVLKKALSANFFPNLFGQFADFL